MIGGPSEDEMNAVLHTERIQNRRKVLSNLKLLKNKVMQHVPSGSDSVAVEQSFEEFYNDLYRLI